ncbi:MAG: hypothetical protein ACE5HP_09040 [Gemmatimonadota bacterium]
MPYKCIACGRKVICGEDPHCEESGLSAAQEAYPAKDEKEVDPPFRKLCIVFEKKGACPKIDFEPWS